MKIENQVIPLKTDPQTQKANMEEKLHGASKMYEQHFLNEMLKEMRATVHKDGGFIQPSMAENIFSEKLDEEYVDKWADKGGIGLADMIYNQLHERIFPERRDFSKPAGPIPLQKTSAPFQIKVDKKSEGSGQILFQGEKPSPLVQPTPVQSPWSGQIESANTGSDGWNHVAILHDNEFRSRLAFRGNLSGLKVGSLVEAGQNLGNLGNESPILRWDVSQT